MGGMFVKSKVKRFYVKVSKTKTRREAFEFDARARLNRKQRVAKLAAVRRRLGKRPGKGFTLVGWLVAGSSVVQPPHRGTGIPVYQ
jgi:hypothetical protein